MRSFSYGLVGVVWASDAGSFGLMGVGGDSEITLWVGGLGNKLWLELLGARAVVACWSTGHFLFPALWVGDRQSTQNILDLSLFRGCILFWGQLESRVQ